MTPYSDSSASFLALRLLIEVQDSLLQFYIQCGGRIDINALATAIKEMLAGHDEFEDWDDLDSVLVEYFIWWTDTPHALAQKSTATLLDLAFK